MDKRYLQANKEALLSLALTFVYLILWVVCGYCLKDEPTVLGFPTWFGIACIFVPIGFIILCYLVVRYQFKDIPLDNQSS
ncbi:DUF997 family protein [Orbaceae bacterium ac157xtp]